MVAYSNLSKWLTLLVFLLTVFPSNAQKEGSVLGKLGESIGHKATARIAYATYLGGSFYDQAIAMTTDSIGNIYLTGQSSSADFPVSPGSFKSPSSLNQASAFLAKFDSNGTMIYSTLIGGSTVPLSIVADADGNAYITGYTSAADFPTTDGALVPSTRRLENQSRAIFVTKVNALGTALVYSAILGNGLNNEAGTAIAVDEKGQAVVAGYSASPELYAALGSDPARPGSYFLAKLNANGAAYVFAKTMNDRVSAIATNQVGELFLTGSTFDTALRGPGVAQPRNGIRRLFRTTDAGRTWAAAEEGLESLSVLDIVGDSSTPSILYASGLGNPFSRPGGVFQSRDGGKTWIPFLTARDSFRTVIDPADAQHVVAFTRGRSNNFVPYTTRDGGATWKALAEVDFDDITFDPSKPQNAYAAGTNAIYYSRDGGDTWTRSASGSFRTKPAMDPSNPDVLYAASYAGVLKSTNAGVSWGLIAQFDFRKIIVHPTKRGVLFGITNGSLYNSLNEGATWSRPQGSSVVDLAFDPVDRQTLYLFNNGYKFPTILQSADGGTTVQPLASLPPNPTLTSLAFDRTAAGSWLSLSAFASDSFVTRLSADAGEILFSTYFGGSGSDAATGISLDANGGVYITGNTNSRDLNGSRNASAGQPTAFVAHISADGGEVISSQFVGGSRLDYGRAIVTRTGGFTVVGATASSDFPVTSDAFQSKLTANGVSFFSNFNSKASPESASFLPGDVAAAVMSAGRLCIFGTMFDDDLVATPDAFQTKFGGRSNAYLMILDVVE